MHINAKLVNFTFESLVRKGDKDALAIMECFDAFYRYFSCVEVFEEKKRAFKSVFSIEDYRYEYKRLDENRTRLHNEAITALEKLCTICKANGFVIVDKNVSTTHRTEIAEAIFEFLKENNN